MSSNVKLLFTHLINLADGEQIVKVSERGSRGVIRGCAGSLNELKKLDWIRRETSVTPAGDCAATVWKLPRVVIQTTETVCVERVSCTGQNPVAWRKSTTTSTNSKIMALAGPHNKITTKSKEPRNHKWLI